MWNQQRLNSACASAQSDQSFRYPHEETLHAWLCKLHQWRFWSDCAFCANALADLNPRWAYMSEGTFFAIVSGFFFFFFFVCFFVCLHFKPETDNANRIFPKYSQTWSLYHTSSKVWTWPSFFLLMCLNYYWNSGKQCRPWSDAVFDSGLRCSGLSVQVFRLNKVILYDIIKSLLEMSRSQYSTHAYACHEV